MYPVCWDIMPSLVYSKKSFKISGWSDDKLIKIVWEIDEKPAAQVNPYPAKLIHLNFQPFEVVSRYRDTQPQVVENYWYLFNLKPNIYKCWCLNTQYVPNNIETNG